MKVFIGQINTTPGDFEGNVAKIIDGLNTIKPEDHVDMAVFPELSICGYLSKDLVFEEHYIEKNLQYLQVIVGMTSIVKDIAVIVGYVDYNKTGTGKPFANMLAVIRNGVIIGTYQKHLLPFYNVFHEGRYFEPGKELLILNIAGEKVAFTICEDIWNNDKGDEHNYSYDPIDEYKRIGVDVIVNISSSPFVHNKPTERMKMLMNISKNDLKLVYVNQIGGQDDLVFDGNSCVLRNCGKVGVINPPTDPSVHAQYKIFNTNDSARYVEDDTNPFLEQEVYYSHKMILSGLYDYVTKSGFKKVVLGSSGGIDSAVVAALACEAFGPDNVHCIMMPSVNSSEGSVIDAQALHKNLGCHEYKLPIEYDLFVNSCHTAFDIKKDGYIKSADENVQARLRGMAVMYFSNALGALPLTTGNKTELATGYCTLYGDMNGGFAPISDLYKMQVYDLARYINKKAEKEIIPTAILNKAPSAELAPGQTDEASLLPYPVLDKIVKAYIEEYIDTYEGLCKRVMTKCMKNSNELCVWLSENSNTAKKDFLRIIKLININEFKRRQAAPGIKVSKIAFGSGRMLPIVKKTRI